MEMRDVMRRRVITAGIVVLACSLLSGTQLAEAQSADYDPPRLSNGTPDFNGIWQALNVANYDVEPHIARSAMQLREGRTLKEENQAHWVERDPEIKCYMPGVPRATYMPFPFQIFQNESSFFIAYEFAGAVRDIYLQDVGPAETDSWMGQSVGRWDGDTLVVETRNFLRETNFMRGQTSEHLTLTERFTRVDENILQYDVTIDDPTVWTQPWTFTVPMQKNEYPVYEYACHEGNYGLENILAGAIAED